MLTDVRRHLTFANIAALAALVIAVCGSGTAVALVVTSSDVKNESLTGRDIKNRSLTSAEMSTATRTSFTQGPQWALIPRGQTVVGEILVDTNSSTSGDYEQTVNLPGIASVDLDANFEADALATTIDDDATCTGSYNSPAAPPGKVCVYLSGTTADATNIQAQSHGNLGRRTFGVQWTDTAANDSDVYLKATWAYHQPA